MYRGTEALRVHPKPFCHFAVLDGWKRPLPPHLIKAHKAGKWKKLKTTYIE